VKDFLLTLFREQDPFSRAKAQGRKPSEMIAEGVKQVDASMGADPGLQAELRRDLGEIQLSMGDRAAAVVTLKRAWDQQKQLSGEDSAASATAQALYASALLQSGDAKQAEPLLRGALDRLRASLGPDHLRTVDAEIALARLELMIGHDDESLKLLQHGVDVYTRVYGPDAPELVPRLTALSGQYVELSQFDKSNEISHRALRIIERHNGPDHVLAIVPHTQIADALRYQQKYAEALPEMDAAVRIARSQLPAANPIIAGVLIRYGDLLRRMQRYDEAEQVFAEGVAKLQGSSSGEYAQMLQVYGTLASARGAYALASERFRKSMDVFRKATGDSTFTWLTALLLIDSLGQDGQLEEADTLAKEASRAFAGMGQPDSYESGYLSGTVGYLRWRQRRFEDSIAPFRHSLKVQIQTYGEQHPEVARMRAALARSLLAIGDADSRMEAASLIEQALPVIEKADAGTADTGVALLVRAELRLDAGDATGAQQDIDAALPSLQGKGLDRERERRMAANLSQRIKRMPAIR
ncbi:MAG: tetratricopeptide repeat protein, partial [Dokdonella sp.]